MEELLYGGRSHLILTAPIGYVIQLDGDVSVWYEDVSVYDGCGTSDKRLFKANQATGGNQAISNVSLHSNGRMMMIEVASRNNPNRGDGLNLTATLREATDLTISNIVIPAHFSRNNGNPIDITYSVNAAGVQLEEGTHYTKTIKKMGSDDVLDEVTENGQYELTITAKEGTGYTGSNSTTFYVCEGLMMTSDMTSLTNGIYSVIEDVTVINRITITGDVKLLLWENATLIASKGIEVNNNNKLTIDGKGTLNVSSYDAAAIGPSSDSELSMGTLVIDGGTINATSTMSSGYAPAAIGTCKDNTSGGSITINGGIVNATSGIKGYASIGGYSSCCDITINGGQVTASGIGCSPYSSANSGSLTLGWTNSTDFVQIGTYNSLASITFKEGQHFKLDGTNIVANMGNIVNKKIVPISEEATMDFASAVVYGMNSYYAYTGSEIDINYNVEDAFGHRLREGVDYTAEISPATVQDKGTYTLTLTPKAGSSYTGSWQKTFQVKDKVNVTSSTTTMTNNFYSVSSNITINSRITITGDVVLDIADGKTLTVPKGIELSGDNMLTIQGSGTLAITAESGTGNAGIGSDEQVGTLIVNGGVINVQSGTTGAGIGCGSDRGAIGGTVIINDGIVNATSSVDDRAGIGASQMSKAVGNIIINGGQVTATLRPSCGTVTIGWTKASDFVNLYMTEKMHVIFAEGKSFLVDESGTEVTAANIYGTDVRGKKLVPKPDASYLDFATLNDRPTINWYTGDALSYTIKDCDGNTLTKDEDYTVILNRTDGSNVSQETEIKENGVYALTVNGIGTHTGSQTFKVIVSSGETLYYPSPGPLYTYMKDNIYIIPANVGFATNNGPLDIQGDVMIVLEDGCYFMPRGISIGKGCTLTIDTKGSGTGRLITQETVIIGVDGEMGTLIINNGGIEVSQGIGSYNVTGGDVVLNLTNLNSYVKTTYHSNLASITIPADITLYDGTNYYNSETTKSTFTSLTYSTKLHPIVPTLTLTARQVSIAYESYWTTFYCGDTGYCIDAGQNAKAYTATYSYDNDEEQGVLTMHELGKVIPAATPVIIVSETATVNMTMSNAAAEKTVENNLSGTDARVHSDDVPVKDTKAPVYVLGKKDSYFGFLKFKGYIPPHKAYLQLSDSNAPEHFTMTFEETTDIISIENEELRIENSAGLWYDMQGRKLSEKPSTKGLYIYNGRKIVIK